MTARCALLLAILLSIGCASSPATPPTPADCITLRLWSNGWHSSLALPARVFNNEHPIRQLFPGEDYFLIGWGARDFYLADDPGVWQGLTAIIPPTRSAIHVIASDAPVEEGLWRPKRIVEFAVSEAAAKAMAERLAGSLSYDENGAPIVLREGRVAGASYFLAAADGFHLLHMCNHWTARRLREAGAPISPALSFTAPALLRAVARKMPASCPPSDGPA